MAIGLVIIIQLTLMEMYIMAVGVSTCITVNWDSFVTQLKE